MSSLAPFNPTEAEILRLWDGAASIERIAERLGLRAAAVADVVGLYHAGPTEREAEVRRGLAAANAAYVAACAREAARSAQRRRAELIEVGEIENMLRDRAETLVWELFPNARKAGHEMTVGSLAGEPGGSLSIHVGSGPKRGMWKDFAGADSAKGDMLCLIEQALFGGDRKRAVQWAKSFLRIQDGDAPEADRARIEQMRLEAAANGEKRRAEAEAQRKAIIASAVARWHQGSEIQRDDPVDCYLRGRGIDLRILAEANGGKLPSVIRYNPQVQYGPSEKGAPPPYRGPALVAMVTALDCTHIATHRIWLAQRPDGKWDKAGPDLLGRDERTGEPNDPKKVLASPVGGHIPLWKGTHKCPLRDLPAGVDIYCAEGVEDGLTAACADPSLRVISAVALSFLPSLELPDPAPPAPPRRLVWLKQNDPPGSDPERMLERAVAAQRAKGRRVGFVSPPAGEKDLNDLAQRGMA